MVEAVSIEAASRYIPPRLFLSLVQYHTLESAVATRTRLHGLKWPSTNPKLLAVDFLAPQDALGLSEGQLVVGEELMLPTGGPPEEVGVAAEEAKEEDGVEKIVETVDGDGEMESGKGSSLL